MMDMARNFLGMGTSKEDKEAAAEAAIKAKEQQDKLQVWKERLQRSLSVHDTFRSNAAIWDELYNGTKDMNDTTITYMTDKTKDNPKAQEARQVVNITYQLIESQIDIGIPSPRVDAMEQDDAAKTDMVEGMLTSIANSAELERINAENERIVKKNGFSVFKVSYDPNYKAHTFIGRIKTTNPHPCNIIPQQGVYNVEDMDYMFQIENRTLDYVCREYGEEFRAELEEEAAEYSYLESFSATASTSRDTKGTLSVVEAWYRDKDGDIGLLTWCNETILRDVPKFYYKRDESGQLITSEQLELQTGEVDPMTGQPMTQMVEVECYIPKRLPYVIQYNIPKEKSFYGLSDPFIIKDQQQGIKKMLSIEEEKQVKGTTKIFTRKGANIKANLTNATSQIIETDDPQADINVVDLKTPDRSLLDLYTIYKQAAKDSLGVTEASQGRAENSNLSGRALEQLAQYSQNRLSVKTFEKQRAYKELFNLYYDFLLAFYDDKVPFKIQGKDNKPKYGYFDKSQLIKQDIAGAYYYPQFDIYISADQGIPKDKTFILQTAQEDFKVGALDKVEYWMIKESVGYPNASVILDMEQQKAEASNTPSNPPSTSITFKDLPTDGKVQLAAQAGIKLDPNVLAQEQALQQAQQQAQQGESSNDNLQQEIDSLPPDMKEYLMKLPPDKQQEIIEKYMETMNEQK